MAKSQPEGQKVEAKALVKTSKLQNAEHGPSQTMQNYSWNISQYDSSKTSNLKQIVDNGMCCLVGHGHQGT